MNVIQLFLKVYCKNAWAICTHLVSQVFRLIGELNWLCWMSHFNSLNWVIPDSPKRVTSAPYAWLMFVRQPDSVHSVSEHDHLWVGDQHCLIPCRISQYNYCTSIGETILNCPIVGSNPPRSPEPSSEDTFVHTRFFYEKHNHKKHRPISAKTLRNI